MKNYVLVSFLIVALFTASASATLIETGTHTLSFGIAELIYLLGDAELEIIEGGSTEKSVKVDENATLTMLGGRIEGDLYVCSSEPVIIKGGTIGGVLRLDSSEGGDVYIYGSDFAIDGVPVQPGTYHQTGTFTAVLENGDEFNSVINFYASNNVVLVPEPATLLILTMGALYIRKRKTTC